jgi:hypothetical protein
VYLYVSGFFGGGISSTPTVGLSAQPSGVNCTVTLGSPTSSTIDWVDVDFVLTDITTASDMGTDEVSWSYADGTYMKAGQIISVDTLVDGTQYRLTLSYTPTGGQLGTTTWTQ